MSVTLEKKGRGIERTLREEIAQGKLIAGERLAGEHALARRFGVSYMTIRQAVSSLVTDGLLLRINGKGTFVVETAAGGKVAARLVIPMLLLPPQWHRADPSYFPDVYAGFEERVGEAGHEPTILDYAAADRMEQMPAGAVIACLLLTRKECGLVERIRDRGGRVLAINRYCGRRAIPSVLPDNAGGVGLAVDHLVSLGHTRIGFIAGIRGNIDAIERRDGFRRAMRAQGLSADVVAGHHFHESVGYKVAQELLYRPEPPTALVCASDMSAIGAIKAIRERGYSIPGDISVVGFGDFSVAAYVDPGLTTVCLPRHELGAAAASHLLILAKDGSVSDYTVPTYLIVRGTTAPPHSI